MKTSTLLLLIGLALGRLALAQPLPDTRPLEASGDLSAEMVAGIGRWLERTTDEAAAERARVWHEAATGGAWDAFASERQQRLRRVLGATDRRTPGLLEEVITAGAEPAASAGRYSVHRVRWPVFEGVHGEGLLFRPTGKVHATIIVVPDADEIPEQSQLAPQLAARGCLVLVPVLVDRRDNWSGSEALQRFTNQPHREWIYRQAFEMGRTLIGYEVQKIQAALDALTTPESPLHVSAQRIGIVGSGEGGLLALHCAALDVRLRATLVRGHFGPREHLFEEPIYRNVFGLLRDFGDAELAALISPRRLIVETNPPLEIAGPPPADEKHHGAAPGVIKTPPLAAVQAEISRANALLGSWKNVPPVPLATDTNNALGSLLAALGLEDTAPPTAAPTAIAATPDFVDARQRRTVRELELFTQRLVEEAERNRATAVWAKLKPGAEWDAAQRDLRKRLWEQSIGKLPPNSLLPHPRSRVIRETPKWIGYEVTLDVLPDVFAWGWLLVPRDLKPGERRPVVVCQHGLEGLPEDVVTDDPKARAFAYYKGFAAKLAEQGFIVYAPHNPYRGQDQFRVLQRRANPLGLSLFSFIVAQHDVTTQWLAGLPFVDPQRIGFYGLSYGGKSAMRIPALLDRYCLSICSGDFNEWIRKNVSPDYRGSYMFTGEYEMPEWNLANVANYAEMAMLIAPRPFMVERGHDDGVGMDEWVGYEYAKVRRGYTKLGLADRTEIEWFDGPHTIHGVGTFEFLHKHLAWPAR